MRNKFQAPRATSASVPIVWFFGQSAAGKCTLIRNIVSPTVSRQLLEATGVDGLPLEVCEESCDPKLNDNWRRRQEIVPQAILDRLKSPRRAALLIKGQGTDIEAKPDAVFRVLTGATPSCLHRIVFVWCDPNEIFRRWKRRSPYYRRQRESVCRRELEWELEKVNSLRREFPVVCIDASNTEYRIRDWPSVDATSAESRMAEKTR